MLEFKRLEEVNLIKEYIKQSQIQFCDISLGVRYMWGDDFMVDYAIFDHTLILKESCNDYQNAFYYPMGKNIDGAIEQIEEYTLKNNIPLQFCCLDNKTAGELSNRYKKVFIYNDRDWSDYIYNAEKFKTYSGNKLSGQRNHVNKFKRLYPNYKFKQIEKEDFSRIKDFLNEFESNKEFLRWSEKVEQRKVFDLVENMQKLNQVGGLIEVDNKVIAFSVGEIINDTLIVHIEKALTQYAGIYPTMAQEFAKEFCNDGVELINREEDCGDSGLRISKLQYQPLEVKEKNILQVKRLFDFITSPILIKTDRLEICDIIVGDKTDYFNLYTDEKLNEFWGYDYREDLGDKTPTEDYFFTFQKSLKEKGEEYSLAVKLNGKMIGELVLHGFDYQMGVEIGFRFFSEYQSKGYAIESASALIDYVKQSLGANKIKAKCFKQNEKSKKLIEKLGLKIVNESSTHYYFIKQLAE